MQKKILSLLFVASIGLSICACGSTKEKATVESIASAMEQAKEFAGEENNGDILRTDLENVLSAAKEEFDPSLLASNKTFEQTISDYLKSASSLEECCENLNILEVLDNYEIQNETIRDTYAQVVKQYIGDRWIEFAFHVYDKTDFYTEIFVSDIQENMISYVKENEIPISYEYEIPYMYQVENPEYYDDVDYFGDFAITLSVSESDNKEGKLRLSTLKIETNSAATICHATITNNSPYTYQYLKVKGVFKDAIGNVVNTGWSYAVGGEGLAPGETKTFDIYTDRSSSTESCEMTILDLPMSEYITDSTYETYTNQRMLYWFHHTSYDVTYTNEYTLDAFKDWHYVDGYLVWLGQNLKIVELDEQTITEVEEFVTLSEDEKTYRMALYKAENSVAEALDMLKTLPEGYSDSQYYIDIFEQIASYEGEYLIKTTSGGFKYAVKFNLTFGTTYDEEGQLLFNAKVRKRSYYGDDYHDAADSWLINRDESLLNDNGKVCFECHYCGVTCRWYLETGKITIYNMHPSTHELQKVEAVAYKQ